MDVRVLHPAVLSVRQVQVLDQRGLGLGNTPIITKQSAVLYLVVLVPEPVSALQLAELQVPNLLEQTNIHEKAHFRVQYGQLFTV